MRRTLTAFIELAIPFVVVAAAWQAFSLFGPFSQKLFSTVETIIAAFIRLAAEGILPIHAFHTMIRLLLAFLLAALVGVGFGIIIGRYRWGEDLFLPLGEQRQFYSAIEALRRDCEKISPQRLLEFLFGKTLDAQVRG
jgi:ABC-type nitrate/sulfonate/bicarbonate transport system permease component